LIPTRKWFRAAGANTFAKKRKRENAVIEQKARKTRNDESRKKTRKRESDENDENAKTRKRENGKTAKTRNVQIRKAVFAGSKRKTTANQTSNQRRTEIGKTRQDENAKTAKSALVIWFSRFLVSVAASCWPGRVFYVLWIIAPLRRGY